MESKELEQLHTEIHNNLSSKVFLSTLDTTILFSCLDVINQNRIDDDNHINDIFPLKWLPFEYDKHDMNDETYVHFEYLFDIFDAFRMLYRFYSLTKDVQMAKRMSIRDLVFIVQNIQDTSKKNPHEGTDFYGYLKEEGIYDEVMNIAKEKYDKDYKLNKFQRFWYWLTEKTSGK